MGIGNEQRLDEGHARGLHEFDEASHVEGRDS